MEAASVEAGGCDPDGGPAIRVVRAGGDAAPPRERPPDVGAARETTSGLDFLGRDWHYSAHDDRLIADRLTPFIAGLPTGW